MKIDDRANLVRMVAALPEVYQPIYGHPELSADVSRRCDDRCSAIRQAYMAIEKCHGRPLRVLDLGCAQGYFSLHLATLGAKVTGIDISTENIAVCQALAIEANLSNLEFRQTSIETVIESLRGDEYDLALGLSVFHHMVHTAGLATVRDWIATLSRTISVTIFELALDSEPAPWAVSQPADVWSLITDYAFAHEVGRFPTHLSDVSRPLFVASNRLWYLDGDAKLFTSWKRFSHDLAGEVHQGTRRYYEGDGFIAKLFRIDAELGRINIAEVELEARFLADHPFIFPALPKLVSHGCNAAEAWLVRERIPGKLLAELMQGREPYDGPRVIRDILSELAVLESAGLYHSDVRVWNVIVKPDGAACLLDFGAVSEKRNDCVWPDDPVMSFWLFVHDVAAGTVERIFPQRRPFMSPMSLPEPFRAWALAVWEHPLEQWSFSLLLRCLEFGDRNVPAGTSNAGMLWMAEIESHLDKMGAHALYVENTAKDHASRLQRMDVRMADICNTQDALGAQEMRLSELVALLGGALDQAAKREIHLTQLLMESGGRSTDLAHQLTAVHAAYASIQRSRSWRITLPLRVAFQLANRAALSAKAVRAATVRVPRRIASVCLRGLLNYVRADPKRTRRVARLLRHAGWLDARLRRFAQRNPPPDSQIALTNETIDSEVDHDFCARP